MTNIPNPLESLEVQEIQGTSTLDELPEHRHLRLPAGPRQEVRKHRLKKGMDGLKPNSGSCSKAFLISTACSCFSQNLLKALYSDSWLLLLQRGAGRGGWKLSVVAGAVAGSAFGVGGAAGMATAAVDEAGEALSSSSFLASGELLAGGEERIVVLGSTAGGCGALANSCARASITGFVCSGDAFCACSCVSRLASRVMVDRGCKLAGEEVSDAPELFTTTCSVVGLGVAAAGMLVEAGLATSVGDSPDLRPQINQTHKENARPASNQ